ncbi:hypothetical protein WM46_15470 [Citrobacter freundii complex sp. CFNIH2]|uniref:efflux RND transporter periplasmic adaptor subunit n=1 Tax=Citrobacter freundii complex sp. CFNIH2 TaxID=2066049 RepID=UPI000CA2B432|nr:efflux RND transporter periplasmic adaptor subunit [Citrobacter freundii complex sp. CFNIH2]AUO66037.1 hypothetical protein WM46_15470 [Citrobacter freundii complex sp. CFNIH2]
MFWIPFYNIFGQLMLYMKSKLLLIVIVLILAGTATAFLHTSPNTVPAINTIAVRIGDIEKSVQAVGKIDAAERINVGTQVSGQIKKVWVKPGQSVKKGQTIAEIDDQPQRSELRIAMSRLNELLANQRAREASLKQASQRFQREKRLFIGDAGSQEDYEAAQAALAGARADQDVLSAQLTQARIEVEKKQLDLGYTHITSPLDGIVISISALQGQTVNASQNTPTIALLARLDRMNVRVNISEADINTIHSGLDAYFTIFADPTKKYPAVLNSVALAPDNFTGSESNNSVQAEGAVYYTAMLDVPNPDGTLRIDMTAQVTIIQAHSRDALLVPLIALHQNGGNTFVQISNPDGTLENRQVTTGINDGNEIQIISGIIAGERVVLTQATSASESDENTGAQP